MVPVALPELTSLADWLAVELESPRPQAVRVSAAAAIVATAMAEVRLIGFLSFIGGLD